MRRHLPLLVLSAVVACGGGDGGAGTGGNPLAPSSTGTGTGTGTQPTVALLPTELTMPFRVDDINLRGVINPFGVVRSSLDEGAVGHPGIDIPLSTGAPLFAPTVTNQNPWGWALWTATGGLIFGFLREKSGAVVTPALVHGALIVPGVLFGGS